MDLHFETASLNKDVAEESKDYVTKVFDIDEDEMIHVLMPMEKTKLVLLPVGAVYDASFYCTKGIYGARAKVVKRYKEDALFVLVIELETELEKQQRREFYRYDCVIGMMTRQITDEEKKKYDEVKNCSFMPEPTGKSVVVDISGGGMRFVTSEHYEKGKLLQCRFILPHKEGVKKYDLVLNIVGEQPVANNKANTEYRGPFYEINAVEREEIIKYIFEEERKQRAGKSK